MTRLVLTVCLALAAAACVDDSSTPPPPPPGSDAGGGGSFSVFDCTFEYSCEDGTVASLPLQTCTTQNTLSMLILEADTNAACDDACGNSGSGLSTSCSLVCSMAGAACSCPAGVAECNP